MTDALKSFSTRETSQDEKIPGTDQVPNSAGGFAWAVDKWTRLHRFLILGTEGGSYYTSQRDLTKENAQAVLDCIAEDGPRTVQIIAEISDQGRAPKNDQAVFALALASAEGDERTKQTAYQALPQVCRIGTHLFQFCAFREQFGGWGQGMKRAVQRWYTEKTLDDLSYQLIKYRQREGWTHRDVLRVAHPEPESDEQNTVLRWAAEQEIDAMAMVPRNIEGFRMAQVAESPRITANLVKEYQLPREALRTEHLTDPAVWEAMLYHGGKYGMPITALIRNLANMTRAGLLVPGSDATKKVIEMVTARELLTHARVHPIAVLAALKTYEAGFSVRGSNTWSPVPQIVDALDEAFYAAFDNLEPTGKRYLLALDVSGSMGGGYVGGVVGLTPRIASAAMAMVTMKTGDPYEVVAFTGGSYWNSRQNVEDLSVLSLSPRQRLDDIVRKVDGLPFGGTDCALPMIYAEQNNREIDVFAVYTDSETWAGNIHPSQALQSYRQKSGINSKLIVVGMVSNGFSIADPNDAGMLDVVGFDTSTPQIMQSFAEGGF
jgi:60 kDa SS-A/Ro ribonucleoprotein